MCGLTGRPPPRDGSNGKGNARSLVALHAVGVGEAEVNRLELGHVPQDALPRRRRVLVTLAGELGGPEEAVAQRTIRWLRDRARDALARETEAYASQAGLRLGQVSVGDPRSRWGSCTAEGNIRYSWRLICAPVFVRQATVAHEVAHLAHMDHSPAFHARHAEIYGGDPRPARRWLRENGAMLHRIGG